MIECVNEFLIPCILFTRCRRGFVLASAFDEMYG